MSDDVVPDQYTPDDLGTARVYEDSRAGGVYEANVPRAVTAHLDVREGDELVFYAAGDGSVRVEPS